MDGYYTSQRDLIYVEDPLFQDPKLTSKDNKSIVELKVRSYEVQKLTAAKRPSSHLTQGPPLVRVHC